MVGAEKEDSQKQPLIRPFIRLLGRELLVQYSWGPWRAPNWIYLTFPLCYRHLIWVHLISQVALKVDFRFLTLFGCYDFILYFICSLLMNLNYFLLYFYYIHF